MIAASSAASGTSFREHVHTDFLSTSLSSRVHFDVPTNGGSYPPCRAASAARASWFIRVKNAGDWPMKSPMSVRNLRAPMATPFVSVGRMIEQIGRLRSKNGHGSGMIKLLFRSSSSTPRSGKVTDTPVTGSTAVNGGALPALSDQV